MKQSQKHSARAYRQTCKLPAAAAVQRSTPGTMQTQASCSCRFLDPIHHLGREKITINRQRKGFSNLYSFPWKTTRAIIHEEHERISLDPETTRNAERYQAVQRHTNTRSRGTRRTGANTTQLELGQDPISLHSPTRGQTSNLKAKQRANLQQGQASHDAAQRRSHRITKHRQQEEPLSLPGPTRGSSSSGQRRRRNQLKTNQGANLRKGQASLDAAQRRSHHRCITVKNRRQSLTTRARRG